MTPERYAEQFLLCALEVSRGTLNEFLDPDAIMDSAQLDGPEKDSIVSLLIAQRYVNSEGERADGSVHLLKLTANDLGHARHLRRISRSKAEREIHLHSVLVRWAHEHAPAGGSASLQEFASDEKWWFAGTQVTWDEVYAAVDYLDAENLLRVERANGYVGVRPTPLGIKFAHSSMLLRTFMTTQQPQSSGTTHQYRDSIVVHGDAADSNLATGGNNTQTVNQGVDTDALASLVIQLRQVAPTLALLEDDAEDLAEEIDALELEGTELNRGRRIWRAIMRIVGPALGSAVAAGCAGRHHGRFRTVQLTRRIGAGRSCADPHNCPGCHFTPRSSARTPTPLMVCFVQLGVRAGCVRAGVGAGHVSATYVPSADNGRLQKTVRPFAVMTRSRPAMTGTMVGSSQVMAFSIA
ncbi:hypothetical protein [Streptomyces sp. DSM 40484]|uniref:hypothetical protein n=1 Tax=Streptomyces kroppenstedtii TaxID=3051181 RepID=UPI0028CFE6C4|nr:hypothetical protein [Streptomyces sp. DSM 40484]